MIVARFIQRFFGRQAFLVSALVAGGLVFFGATGADAQRQTGKIVAKGETVRIQIYPGTIGSGHPVAWVVMEKKLCEAHGLKCQFLEMPSGTLGLQALAAGSIEISYATTEVAMQAAARGNDIQLIASTHPNLYVTLNASKKLPLPNLAKGYPAIMQDFKGKKIGTAARGSGTEIHFRAMLAGAGMKPEDVTFVAVGSPATAFTALVAGQVDATMSWAPFEAVCYLTEACVTVIDPRKGEGPPDLKALNGASQEYSARRKYIADNPVVIDAFIQAIEDSVKWIKDPKNFEELVTITKRHFSLGNVPNAEAGLRNLVKHEVGQVGATLDRRSVKAFADYMLKYGVLDKPFDTTDFVYKGAPRP